MKLKNDIDLVCFLNQVQTCHEDVYFISGAGDHLSLKSTLSQYMLTAAFGDRELISAGDIICRDQADYQRLDDYLERS